MFLIIFVPFAIAVKYGMRRACTCRPRRAQRPAPPLLALLQHQDSSLPPGSPSTRAATAAPAPAGAVGGPGAGLGSSSQQQHQQLYVPPDAVAPHADTVSTGQVACSFGSGLRASGACHTKGP